MHCFYSLHTGHFLWQFAGVYAVNKLRKWFVFSFCYIEKKTTSQRDYGIMLYLEYGIHKAILINIKEYIRVPIWRVGIIQGITVFKIFIWGGKSSDIRSEILFYGDVSAEP